MLYLYETLLNHRNCEGHAIIQPFMVKPSIKDYPDYYSIIENPIDMQTINDRIKSNNYYKTFEEFSDDIALMFDNCKKYNILGSAGKYLHKILDFFTCQLLTAIVISVCISNQQFMLFFFICLLSSDFEFDTSNYDDMHNVFCVNSKINLGLE